MRHIGPLVFGLLLGMGCDAGDESAGDESSGDASAEYESVNEDVDPSEDPDSHVADIILSGSMGPMLLIGAAVAIPNFIAMQYRSKRAEVPSNVNAIKASLLAYEAEFDRYVAEPNYYPDAYPGKVLRDWTYGNTFDTLGWAPDGRVRSSYKEVTSQSHRGRPDFTVFGITDIDGDGQRATFTATKSIGVRMNTPNDVY